MQPEFYEPNFCNLNINSNFDLILSSQWYSMDESLLYDDTSKELLYTSGADNDATSVDIILDMGDLDFINAVKLLNTNAKTGSIAISDDNISYTTLNSFTNTNTSYHYFNSAALTDYTFLTTETGEILATETGERLEAESTSLGRYIRVRITTTIIPNEEKYIGELYIGRRKIKLSTGKVQSYNQTFSNPRETLVRDYRGRRRKNRIVPVYNDQWTIFRPSQEEADFFTSIEKDGGMYHLFPDPDNPTALDPHMSIDDIFLIEATGAFNRNPYGSGADSSFNLNLMETKYIA